METNLFLAICLIILIGIILLLIVKPKSGKDGIPYEELRAKEIWNRQSDQFHQWDTLTEAQKKQEVEDLSEQGKRPSQLHSDTRISGYSWVIIIALIILFVIVMVLCY
jgi:hypothetical protein